MSVVRIVRWFDLVALSGGGPWSPWVYFIETSIHAYIHRFIWQITFDIQEGERVRESEEICNNSANRTHAIAINEVVVQQTRLLMWVQLLNGLIQMAIDWVDQQTPGIVVINLYALV